MDSLMLTLIRTELQADRVLGELLANGLHFCYTLEDTLRPIKIAGCTAIPAGLYRVTLEWSPKFKRVMPTIANVPNYKGIRIHGGNKPTDTDGCPLVAFKRIGNMIQGTAEKALTKIIRDAGGSCLLVIVDHLAPIPGKIGKRTT